MAKQRGAIVNPYRSQYRATLLTLFRRIQLPTDDEAPRGVERRSLLVTERAAVYPEIPYSPRISVFECGTRARESRAHFRTAEAAEVRHRCAGRARTASK